MKRSIYLQNIRSLRQNYDQLEVYLNQLSDEPLALVLTETRCSDENNLEGYRLPKLSTLVTYNRDNTGGGVGIFYSTHTKLLKVIRSSVKNVQIISAILQSGPEVLIETGVYKYPNYPIDEILALLGDHMTKLKSKEAPKHVIIVKFVVIFWISAVVIFWISAEKQQNGYQRTTCSNPCIDLFFSNFEGECNVDKTALSDHYTVYFSATFFANLDTTTASEFINS